VVLTGVGQAVYPFPSHLSYLVRDGGCILQKFDVSQNFYEYHGLNLFFFFSFVGCPLLSSFCRLLLHAKASDMSFCEMLYCHQCHNVASMYHFLPPQLAFNFGLEYAGEV
jgi:hypothetical protein